MGADSIAKLEFTKEAQTAVNILADYVDSMAMHERTFVGDLQEKFERFGDETFVSQKQINWLRSLLERHAG